MRDYDVAFTEMMELEREIKSSNRCDKEYFFFVMNKIYELTDETGDFEYGHVLADKLMTCVLERLGYEDGTILFKHIKGWYA